MFDIDFISSGLEKYMAFMINKYLVFIDSMEFMNASLDVWVKNLSDDEFEYLSPEVSGDLLRLVKQKGVYLYEYMNVFKNFSKSRLSDKDKLYSPLKDKCVSEKNYSYAFDVWNAFKMKAIGHYHDLYLKTDVFLLADVFEKLISASLEHYRLNACHYFSRRESSWDAMLKMTGAK